MNNIFNLYKGELKRLFKYKIMAISFGISLFMGILIYSTQTKEEAINIYRMLLYSDIVILGMMITMSSLFLERQEGIIKSLIVSPITNIEIIMSKVLGNITLGLQSFVILSTSLFITIGYFNASIINFYILIPAILVSVVLHTSLAFIFNYLAIDFSNALLIYSGYAVIFSIPSILIGFIDSPEWFNNILLISPSHSSNILLTRSMENISIVEIIFSFIYLSIVSFVLLKFIVIKKFKEYASRGD